MKIIYNTLIPLPGFKAINLFGIVFTKRKLKDKDINHEAIHTAQMKELLYIFFYIWYLIEYLILLFKYRNKKKAYRSVRFEKEAYNNEADPQYLKNRIKYNYI